MPAYAKPKTSTPCLTMKLPEAADALGVAELTMRAMIDRGEIRHIRIGRRILIPLDSIREFVSRAAAAGRP